LLVISLTRTCLIVQILTYFALTHRDHFVVGFLFLFY
jgi:hypothetical protein